MDARTRRVYRVAASLTQAQVAAAVGISQSHFAQIELGRVIPDDSTAAKIAAALGVTPDKLFTADQRREKEIA